jgi:hypothetical protein
MRVFVLFLSVFSAGAQTLNDQQFQISYGPAGITSLRHTNDSYPTEYLAPGRTLGDLVIRYRADGETEWKEIGAAGGNSSPAASFLIGTPVPTIASRAHASSSAAVPAGRGGRGFGGLPTAALQDQVDPQTSHDNIARFTWQGKSGSKEWVQYDFDSPQTVSFVEVFWAEAPAQGRGGVACKLPQSWKIQFRDGDTWKDVQTSAPYTIATDRFNRADFQKVTTSALRIEAQLQDGATAGILEWRVETGQGRQAQEAAELEASEDFRLGSGELTWTIHLRNKSPRELEIGDLAVPFPFNTSYAGPEIGERRLIRHSFVGGDGSFIFWQRANTDGPYLVLNTGEGTGFEYFDQGAGPGRGAWQGYIHSTPARAELTKLGGSWRLPPTERKLASGKTAEYGFRFRFAKDYDGVRDVLYQAGGFDVNVVPGMTIPTDLPAKIALRTRNKIDAIEPQFQGQTSVKDLGERGKDVHIYEVRFSKLGENTLRARYANGRYLAMDFFVTEPLETVIAKRAAFLVTHEQHKDPAKWYYGLFSQWDQKHQILRSPDDLDGLQAYAVACDDPALGKAPFLAEKNIYYPNQSEIDALELYLRKFVWGGLQETDKEQWPYAIYGIDNWKKNRESPFDDRRGKQHVWREYDYPHVILLYYNMYRIAKDHPAMVKYLDKSGYLQRAYGTALAFWTIPHQIDPGWNPYGTGFYNELVMPELIRALEENGRNGEADTLRGHWEKKARYFITEKPNLFASEYAFDSTGYESTHALARYAMEHPGIAPAEATKAFLENQMRINIGSRGWLEPAYYWLGSDYRGGGNGNYLLSYMAQMGGWAVEDYALNFAGNAAPYLRLGYASYLSSWALVNSGTAESNYGYWNPGKENDGAAGGGFEVRPWGRAWLGNKEMGRGSWWYSGEIDLGFNGALRTAATVVTDDPIFGLFAYGGDLRKNGTTLEVVPKDGLRARLHVLLGGRKLSLAFDHDGFAKGVPVSIDESLSKVAFQVENRSGDAHQTQLEISAPGTEGFDVSAGSQRLPAVRTASGIRVEIPVAAGGATVTLTRR